MTPPPEDISLPTSLTGHAGYLAVVLGQNAQAAFEAAIEPFDLRPYQYDYLAVLADLGPQAQRALARILEIDPSRIVAITDDFERRGLVERTVDAHDRRRNSVRLTTAGRQMFRRVSKVATRVESELLTRLSTSEQDTLRRLLQRTLRLDEPS